MTLAYGAAAVLLLWWLTKKYAGANPASLGRLLRVVGGVTALGAATTLLLTGRVVAGSLVAAGAAWLLGWKHLPGPLGRLLPGFGGRAPDPAAVSRVRSAVIEMELDHDTGRMAGTVLAGRYAGAVLDGLDEQALLALMADCAAADPEGARLLEAYLDRRFPGWREHAQGHRDPWAGGEAKPGAMTEQEAYEVLGLQPGADPEAVRNAHRALMKKLHPDQGGSTYLAARVNQAKETLLGRHR